MRNNIHRFLMYCLIFILQIIFDYFVNLGPYIYLCLVPLMILLIPMDSSPAKAMIVAFGFGLVLDILSDGVLGLNAAAAVVLAAFRYPLFYLYTNSDSTKKSDVFSVKNIGLFNYLKFITICVAVYLTVYVVVDCISIRPALFILLRLLSSIAVTSFTIIVISYTIIGKD